MNAAAIPLNMLAGVQSLDSQTEGWTLVGPSEGDTKRSYRLRVLFERPFAAIPVVHLGIVGLDVSNEDYARLSVRADEIGSDGFVIVAETWFASQVFRVDVSWLALGH